MCVLDVSVMKLLFCAQTFWSDITVGRSVFICLNKIKSKIASLCMLYAYTVASCVLRGTMVAYDKVNSFSTRLLSIVAQLSMRTRTTFPLTE